MRKFERFPSRKPSQHESPVNTIQSLIVLICIQLSFVNSASLILKPPTKCGDPGVPAFGKLLTNNPILPPANLQARSSPPTLITSQNDFIVSNNSEISIDILNFNNNGLDANQAVYEQGEIVSYSCFVGHLMVGSAHRKCLPNGKWSGVLPVCDTLLDQFDLMKSVELTNPDTSSNSSNSGSSQESSFSTLTAHSVNYLKFSPPELAIDHRFGTCFHSEKYGLRMLRLNLNKSMRILGVAITIPKENLGYEFSVYVANSKQNMGKGRLCLQFRGTFATKTTILLCQTTVLGDRINIEDNSKQIQTFSICEVQIYIEKDEIDCGEPEIPLNGLIVSRARSGVEYQCKLGYYLTGSTVRQCQKNGLYGGEQAVCNEIQCKEESQRTGIEDQQLSLQISAQLNGIQLNCEPGYQFAGIRNHSIVCLGDGRFDTRISPLCESIDCGSPLYISEQVNGEFVPLLANRTTYGSMAKLRCFDAQSVYSSEHVLITCGSDGQWSAPKAICVSDPLRSSNQTRQLKNRLGTLIVSVLLILVLLILLLTIYLFKKRILLLAMNLNENKLAAETNLRRNVHLISTNGGVATNPNLINSIGPELCLDSSSNSENNSSSQPSSKISIRRLFRRRADHSADTQAKKFINLNALADKLFRFKRSVQTSKLSSFVNCLGANDPDQLSANANEQYTITNELLNSHLNGHLNPIFIDQLDHCQDTSIKECAFRQYSSTLKHQQISLVRLQNAQRAARLIKASNCHFNPQFSNQFNQLDPINHFVRQQLITSSMKSDSLLISTRRQIVRDQLIKTIRHGSNEQRQHAPPSNATLSSQLIQSRQQFDRQHEAGGHRENGSGNGQRSKEEEGKQFYYFAEHCFTLPQNHHLGQTTNRHQIGRLVQPDAYRATLRETFGNPTDICPNASDTSSSSSESGSSKSSSNGSSTKSSSENSTNAKTKSNCGLAANLKSSAVIGKTQASHESDLERKVNRTLTTTTADIHLNKNFKKLHPGSGGQVDVSIGGLDRLAEQTFETQPSKPSSANKLSRLKASNKVTVSTEASAEARLDTGLNADVNNVNNSTASLKYIVIDDVVFAD